MRKTGFHLSLLASLLISSVQTIAAPADNIIISEVQYDPAAPAGHSSSEVENEAEWFELYNPTANPIDVGGWTIKEGGSPTYTFPSPTVIAAGDYLLVTNRADRFNLIYPSIVPDLEMQPGGAGLLKLNNGGDQLTLKNNAGTVIDFVAWEGYVATWDAQANDGESVCRILNTDNDTGSDWDACIANPGAGPGFSLSQSNSVLDEATTDTFNIVLDSQPINTVVINIASDDAAASISPTSLTFTNADWNQAQSVTINAVEDSDLFDEEATITASIDIDLSDDNFDSLLNQTVSVSVRDTDLAKISIDDISHVEGHTGNADYQFSISLDQISPDDVSVEINSGDASATVADNDYIAISNINATIPAGSTSTTINVQSTGDLQVESDENFYLDLSNPINAVIIDSQGIATIRNDDTAGFTLQAVTQTLNEGTTTSLSVVLTAQPINDVVIELNSADIGALSLSANSLSFNHANWDIPQLLTLQAEEDADRDDENTVITASINTASTDDFFDALEAQQLNLTVIDTDILDTDGDGIPDESDTDKDNDGNPDNSDPHPLNAQVEDNFVEVTGNAAGEIIVTLDILSNDDFIPGGDVSLSDTGNGNAIGEVSFNPLTGEMTYHADPTEQGSTVTIEYQVCNTVVTPEVCAVATVTITIASTPIKPPIKPPSSIPTLSEWMLLLLSLLLFLIGKRKSSR